MNESKFSYGGQAVIEGVMMRGKQSMAIATRQAANNIGTMVWEIKPTLKRPAFLRWPLVRGTVALVDSMLIGVKSLVYSANQSLADGEEEEELTNTEIVVTVTLALGLGVVLFFLLPAFLAQIIQRWAPGRGVQNVLEGLMRAGIFLLYVIGISRLKDIQRVFQYHGAEHKTIFTYESGKPLTVENAREMSRLHPRCGTSFLLLVIVVSILLYSMLPPLTMTQRLLSRLVLLPLISGISYEMIRLAGRKPDNPLVAAISWPGMQLQRLTTREPDDSQLEVAIAALTRVLQDDGVLPVAQETPDELFLSETADPAAEPAAEPVFAPEPAAEALSEP
ncbi:MAG: DUF1385 domain-containing protein [Clostridiales bacterium]|nr:DUF1385 domain-containing protein [Clostridiales bacterium]